MHSHLRLVNRNQQQSKLPYNTFLPPANEVCEGCFYKCLSFCPQGGGKVPGQVPPGPGTHPRTRYTPLGPGTHPWDQVHPPGPGTPPDQVNPPGPGTPPRTRYTPQDQVHSPGTRYTPTTRYTPDQVHPLGAVHAGRYGQQAGGTHPTGMHSCGIGIFEIQ